MYNQKQMQQQNNMNFNPNWLNDEAVRVNLASRAGRMITKNLVAQGEQILKQSQNSGLK